MEFDKVVSVICLIIITISVVVVCIHSLHMGNRMEQRHKRFEEDMRKRWNKDDEGEEWKDGPRDSN